LLNNH